MIRINSNHITRTSPFKKLKIMKNLKQPTQWKGSCHCGAIRFVFESNKQATRLPLRSCLCSFCVKRGTQCTSDAKGKVRFTVRTPSLSDYDSSRTLKRILCNRCGVYIGTLLISGEKSFVTLNANTFERREEWNQAPSFVDYSGTSLKERKERWKTVWTPVSGRLAFPE